MRADVRAVYRSYADLYGPGASSRAIDDFACKRSSPSTQLNYHSLGKTMVGSSLRPGGEDNGWR